MLSTVDIPRKWSTRWTWSSLTSPVRSSFSERALATSLPNGFSITSRVLAGTPISASARHAFSVTAGGSAK